MATTNWVRLSEELDRVGLHRSPEFLRRYPDPLDWVHGESPDMKSPEPPPQEHAPTHKPTCTDTRDEYANRLCEAKDVLQLKGHETADIVCRKCGSKDVAYNPVQTRSADEPMTIFITCRTNGCSTRI